MIRPTALLSVVFLVSACGWSRVFIRWTQPALPPARLLGVQNLVIPWDGSHPSWFKAAILQGYRVYAEVTPEQARAVAGAAEAEELAGIIVKAADSAPQAGTAGGKAKQQAIEALFRELRSAYPGLSLRLLEPGGKPPQMRGMMVVDRNGVLGVSRPTQQPWIDSNVALIRFEEVYHLLGAPLLNFAWNAADSIEEKYGPPAGQYELAVAEAGAFHADLILPLHKHLADGLVRQSAQALETWGQIRRYIRFYSEESTPREAQLVSNVGVVTDDYESSYEAMNLMARHNIPFCVLTPTRLKAGLPEGMALLVIFSALDETSLQAVDHFASQGGTAVLVGATGHFPWRLSPPIRQNEQSAIYRDGAGRVIEVTAPISNPEPFAQDIARLLPESERHLSLWNALTTLAVAYQNEAASEVVLNLVNYSGEAIRVQVRLKGDFSQIRYATPEQGCCVSLAPDNHDGFTEFIVPSLATGGRVHLLRRARKR